MLSGIVLAAAALGASLSPMQKIEAAFEYAYIMGRCNIQTTTQTRVDFWNSVNAIVNKDMREAITKQYYDAVRERQPLTQEQCVYHLNDILATMGSPDRASIGR